MIPAPERVAADAAYVYGIPALVVVCVGLGVLLVILLPPLTRALLSVAEAGRLIAGAGAARDAAAREAEERAGRERRAILDAVADVKATVVARL